MTITSGPITNTGTLEATTGGTLVIDAGQITGSGSIDVLGGTLALDVPVTVSGSGNMTTTMGGVTLTGGGTVTLNGGAIVAAGSGVNGETLKNLGDTIVATGTANSVSYIGSGNASLTLHVVNTGTI